MKNWRERRQPHPPQALTQIRQRDKENRYQAAQDEQDEEELFNNELVVLDDDEEDNDNDEIGDFEEEDSDHV